MNELRAACDLLDATKPEVACVPSGAGWFTLIVRRRGICYGFSKRELSAEWLARNGLRAQSESMVELWAPNMHGFQWAPVPWWIR